MDDNYIWNRAGDDAPVLVLAHGAGAGMDSDFMVTMTTRLCERNITVVRFEFPYMQQRRVTGKKRPPDRQPKLIEYWHKVLEKVRAEVVGPLFIGGKSMGGRMATLLASELSDNSLVSGVVCLGYPFYAAGKKDKPRIEHLKKLSVPHLIVQGERDAMGDKTTVSTYSLSGQVNICWLNDGNHDLRPRKSSGVNHDQHLNTAADVISDFMM